MILYNIPTYTLLGAKALNGSLGPRTRVPNDRTQMLGPKYRDPNSQDWNVRVPSAGTHRPRTQMKGPRCWDPSVFWSQRSEALYGSLGWRHLMGPQRLEAFNGSPNVRSTLRVPGPEALYGSHGWRDLTGLNLWLNLWRILKWVALTIWSDAYLLDQTTYEIFSYTIVFIILRNTNHK